MKQLTEILPGIWCVEVEADAKNFVIGLNNRLHYYYTKYGDNAVRGLPPGEWQLLGTVSASEISFDVEPYVHKKRLFNSMEYLCADGESWTVNKNNAFRSLLLKHGFYWKNPAGVVPSKEDFKDKLFCKSGECKAYYDSLTEYQQYEQNKLQGILVVLKKIINS